MGSSKGNGRGEGSKRRIVDARRHKLERPGLEALEDRRLLAGSPLGSGPIWSPTDSNPYDVENGPLANLGQEVIKSYHDYETYIQNGSPGTFTPSTSKLIEFKGTSIGVDLHGTGDIPTYVAALKSLGMSVTAVDTKNHIVEGFVPLGNIVEVAREAQTYGGDPIYTPQTAYVGAANNEAETALGAGIARATYGVDGTGIKVGILSDSVNDVGNGLADSVATGDLPNNVQVLQDDPFGGGTDEGRAMLENIHDIVPGSPLAFATADSGEVGFEQNIVALQNAGANYIADDVVYRDELAFQDGPIQQGINTVTANGAIYTSAASNSADSGYLSTFRPVSATVPGLGAGTYMNFDPTGATTATKLGIFVYNGTQPTFEFDQPVYQNGASGVASQLNFYILDANNNVVSSGVTNNVATGVPIQIADTPVPNGQYYVVIQLVSGPAPNHVEFLDFNDGGFDVDHQFGTAGGTSYPGSLGHRSGATTIGTGATPWFNDPPYYTATQYFNEPFSAFGPHLTVFNPDGSALATPVIVQNPVISAPQGGNTSFFGQVFDSTQAPNPQPPPYPGQAPTVTGESSTATNLSQNLPSFFGTSAACENLLGTIVLMRSVVPTASTQQILTALEQTSTLLDGEARGVWNPQAGYGEANTVAAIQYLKTQNATLNVTYIAPGGAQTLTTAPTSITVYFNKPVNINSVTASDLIVTGANGSTVTVGAPIAVDNPTDPTIVRFPITITPAPGKIANGVYLDRFIPGNITSQSGLPLSATVSDQFTVAQVNEPQVVSTSFVGRIVNIVFSESMNANSINRNSVYLFRDNGVNAQNFNPNGIIVSQLQGATFTYNPVTFTATIDLTNVPQTSLPTDHYGLVALSSVTDGVGNPLNGAFNGVFPSGVFPSVATGTNFVQDLGVVTLQAPLVTSLTLAPASDSGITGDNNTNSTKPSFVGQVTAKFPESVSGVQIYAEFNGISHTGVARGALNLAIGSSGRGFIGTYDVLTTTNALGQFTITYPAGVSPLPEGENRIRVVVVGQPDAPPFPGLSSSADYAFRIDETGAYVGNIDGSQATSIPENQNINSLTNLSLDIIDPVNPQTLGDPFAVDPNLSIPALNPTTASIVGNYKLFLINTNGTSVDESSFIKTATFTSTSARVLSSDPYTGRIDLTFGPGLPTGRYVFLALSSGFGNGLSDAAGNPFAGYAGDSAIGQAQNFQLDFNLQPTPTYITDYQAYSPDPTQVNGFVSTGPRANYEIPIAGATPRAPAPPTQFTIDFSNSLNPNVDYTNLVQILRSSDTTTSPGGTSTVGQVDGNFGDLGTSNTGSGYTRVAGVSVTLENAVQGAASGDSGYLNRLLIVLPAGSTLPADYYRLYIPNSGKTAISDIFGNQLDGEFLGYQNAQGKYVDLLPNGQVRGSGVNDLPDLSGDGTQGGAFMTGFVVVPNGNIIYARADAIYNPQISSQTPNGSADRPYPVLAPEAIPNATNGGDLNSVVNSGSNFNTEFDRSGLGTFQPSAFYAAQQLVQETGGPVVILAEASVPTRDPVTGAITQRPFVLQAPSGSDPVANDASASVPAETTLVFQGGSALKLQNAALLVQNQGSALQIIGGPNSYQLVNVTSYKDSSVGGDTNGDPNSTPSAGDYGGIVFRNFSQAALPGTTTARTSLFPGQISVTNNALLDDRLKGEFTNPNDASSQVDAISGADDIMSYVSFLVEKYAGGPVPQTNGIRYDGVTLQDSRPTIVNSEIAFSGGSGSAQAGLSVDVDSLRKDDVAAGPLLRNDTFLNNGLNGIYIRAEVNSGIAEATNAVQYPSNPNTAGGAANYVLDDPYPYLLTSRLVIGSQDQVETGGLQTSTNDRLYVDPGMLVKFEHGSALQIQASGSLNVGDQTYIREFDSNNSVGPIFSATLPNGQPNPLAGQVNPNFVSNSVGLAKVIFTSLNDDAATTSYFDPISQLTTTIVQALAAVPGGSGTLQPIANTTGQSGVPDAARWGAVQIASGAVTVINSAIFRFGGGAINTNAGTSGNTPVLSIGGSNLGARVSITNDEFNDNTDVPINLDPNALLAADPQRPLQSGDPFIHGNVFLNNGLNGVGVQGGASEVQPNLLVNSVWTGSDFTYILRDTIVLGPVAAGGIPIVPPNATSQLLPEVKPSLTLTLQSTLAGTVLADGSTVAAPGVPLIIKELGAKLASEGGVNPPANTTASSVGGAGFIVGVDDGTDPPAGVPEYLVDNGAFAQIRILGIGANQSSGQSRVPVIITSAYNDTVGTTVNNVVMDQVFPGNTTKPSAGDGGVIYFGGNSLTTYDLQDTRSGSTIDNADISDITRIEQQGGGIIYDYALNGNTTFNPATDDPYGQKLGLGFNNIDGFGDQYNQAKQLAISNSNLSTFSDAGFIAHPGYDAIGVAQNFNVTGGIVYRVGAYLGEATHTYFVNDTISNMTTGAEIISETSDDVNDPSPAEAVFLNDTFYNDGIGVRAIGMTPDGINVLSHVAVLVMDSIFANGSTANGSPGIPVMGTGQLYGSDLQYNLYYSNPGGVPVGIPDDQPINGNPEFRDPANGNFQLLAGSAAIDRARSELGPSIFGDMLYPAATIDPTNVNAIPIRNQIGDTNFIGGYNGGQIPSQADIVTLPGEPISQRGFPDLWSPTLSVAPAGTVVSSITTTPTTPGTQGTSANAKTASALYGYTPLSGERDQNGNLRVKDPNSPNVGFGSRPFFDLGAFEYIIQNPPLVEAVFATTNTSPTPIGLYKAGGIAGINTVPTSIQFQISEQLDPTTVNGSSVLLLASGGDGIFGNGNSPYDRTIDLSGKVSFNETTDILTIDTTGIFTNPATLNDEYELILKGTGSKPIKDRNGLALDGYTANDTLALPSGGDDFPGSDFLVNFTIDTHAPTLVSGSFKLAPATDSSNGLNITNITKPTFTGTVSDIFPPANPVQGDQVFVDISTKGDGNFDDIGAATGTTDVNGNFSVTVTNALPNSPYVVGPNGMQGTEDSGFTVARVRIVDQAGNTSATLTTPFSTFQSTGATTGFEIDTTPPKVTSLTPSSNAVTTPNAAGQVVVSVNLSKNIKVSTLNANSILVYRSGGSGIFTGLGVQVPIVAGSIKVTYLDTPTGAINVQFAIAGPLSNDFYKIILKGTGATPITDLAGNALDGAGTGTPGSDYTNGPFTIYSGTSSKLIYVSNAAGAITVPTAIQGSRENPFPTITGGLTAANLGDDVLVLPGTYKEDINLKPLVRLLSADSASTDTAFLPGSPLSTLIYGVPSTTIVNGVTTTGTGTIVVLASNIPNVQGVPTEISGFSIIAPLIGDPVHGTIDTTSSAVELEDANVLVDKNYIINAGIGVNVGTSGSLAPTPIIESNVIAGNIAGVGISDTNATISLSTPTEVINNTIVDNTYGVYNISATPSTVQGYVLNNIFSSNHDLTTARAGTGILSLTVNTLIVGSNLFYQNGAAGTNPANNATGLYNIFNPAALSATPDGYGNFVSNPDFVSARDPRPNGDTPPIFFIDGNYDLTLASPAINAALESVAPATDILYRTPVKIAGKGFPGTGPASIGAFYYKGGGGITVTTGNPPSGPTTTLGSSTTGGGNGVVSALSLANNPNVGGSLPIGTKQFNVVTTSLSPDGTAHGANTGGPVPYLNPPTSVTVDFSDDIVSSSVKASDLVISGSGVNSANPVKATSLTWVDAHTIQFFLTGSFNNTGTVDVTIPAGSLTDTAGDAVLAFSDSFQLGSAPATPATPTTTSATPVQATPTSNGQIVAASVAAVTMVPQPLAVAGPIAVNYHTTSAKTNHGKTAHAAHATKTKATEKHAAVKATEHTGPAKVKAVAHKAVKPAHVVKKKGK